MKLITRDTDYAIRALSCIAADKEKVYTVTELTKSLDVPRPFLRKILQILNHKGLLKSHLLQSEKSYCFGICEIISEKRLPAEIT